MSGRHRKAKPLLITALFSSIACMPVAKPAQADQQAGCDGEQWADWADLLIRYAGQPEETRTRSLFVLNHRLCDEVAAGRLTEADAAEQYSRAREEWLIYMKEMIRRRDEATGRREAG